MNQNKETTHLPRAGATTEIPGPYLSPEQTESFPLNVKPNSRKYGILRTCCCWSCCSSFQSGGTQSTGGLRPVVACFFTFSLALTVALVLQIRLGEPQVLPHGSVASDSRECSQIGASILRKGGNAVDAAVATTICLGIVLPHLTGIGGGGFMAIYDHRMRMVVDAIDFREAAPQNIEHGPGVGGSLGKTVGGHTIAVPGLLKGLGLAHRLYGVLPWADLIAPTISLCRTGFLVPSNLVVAKSRLVSSTFTNQVDSSFWKRFEGLEAGHNMTDLQMANTLQSIANEGPDAFYNGSLTDDLIESVTESGGQLTRGDLEGYEPVQRSLIRIPFGPSSWVYSMGAPSGGPLLLASLKLFSEYHAAEVQGQNQSSTEVKNNSIMTGVESESESITNILKDFSIKFTPTESANLKNTDIYVTPYPHQSVTSRSDDRTGVTHADFSNVDISSKLKNSENIQLKKPFKSQIRNPYQNLNGTQNQPIEEIGKAIIEPYKLRRKRLAKTSLDKEGAVMGEVKERKSSTESDLREMQLVLKSLKDASILHSQLGDPDYSKYPNEDSRVALDPLIQLKMAKKKNLSDGETSEISKQQFPWPAGSNVAVVDADELYVSVVSGLNTWFGSQVYTAGGYLLNNALLNFFGHVDHNSSKVQALSTQSPVPPESLSLPPSLFPTFKNASAVRNSSKKSEVPNLHERNTRQVEEPLSVFSDNHSGSGKRPLSASSVAFVIPRRGSEGLEGGRSGNDGPETGVEACGQRMILGSADAVSVAQVLIQIIFKGSSLVEGIEATRVKPLVSPRNFGIEVGADSNKWDDGNLSMDSPVLKGTPLPLPYPSVNGVQKVGDVLASHSDSRGGGVAARF